jgi:hypothetical protein
MRQSGVSLALPCLTGRVHRQALPSGKRTAGVPDGPQPDHEPGDFRVWFAVPHLAAVVRCQSGFFSVIAPRIWPGP